MRIRLQPLAASIAVAFAIPAVAQTPLRTLDEVVVEAARERDLPGAAAPTAGELERLRAATSDTASLLREQPGVSLYGAGGVSSLPVIHGLADDRLRIRLDGMDLIASCPNHMNPPLSYVDPSNLKSIKVYAGITPVSVGGDSIGGSIVAETRGPDFAQPGQGLLTKGEVGTYYRSNGDQRGVNLSATVASENLSLSYSGALAKADNYKAGGEFKNFTATGRGNELARNEVGSSAYDTRNHTLGFALRGGNHLVELKLGYQDLPYQLYANQRMDMLDNEQKRANLRWLGQFDWGRAEARVYHEAVDHYMNFGMDKQLVYGTAVNGMPMYSRGRTTGVETKAEIDLADSSLLRLGALYQHYTLRDWWPPSGTGGMSPGTFENIADGSRDRAGLFGEWEKRFSPQWTTQLGLRYERVTTDAGDVHGYGNAMGNQLVDAAAFNAREHKKTDNNWDLTALARYAPSQAVDVELGFAHKTRSPNLYERYTWSTWAMAAVMNNTVGDGNGYVGDPDLKAEKANTLSATFDWHAADRRWELKATPFYTRVTDYIDAVRLTNNAGFNVLRYTNQTARLFGLDLSGRMPLGNTALGQFAARGLVNYTNGKNLDTGDDLYNIMPLNTRLSLTHELGGWNNAVEMVAARAKNKVSDARNEVRTPGYALFNLRTSYTWRNIRVDAGVENLFDKLYYQPTGGTYTGQGTTMGINSIAPGIGVPGMGRTFYAGLNVRF